MAASRPDPQARLEGTVVVLRELIENDLPALFTAIGRQPGSRRELAWPPLTREEGHPKATYKLLKQSHFGRCLEIVLGQGRGPELASLGR